MSTSRFVIESYMEEMKLKYFFQEEGTDSNWALFFDQGEGFILRLVEEGEFLLIRSFPLAQLDQFSCDEVNLLHRELLKRNDKLMLGHYSSDTCVLFEAGLPIEDGEVTLAQLRRLVGSVLSEINSFRQRLSDMLKGEPKGDAMDSLMQRLIEGDHPNAT